MARLYHIVVVLIILLALGIKQGQGDHASAREVVETLLSVNTPYQPINPKRYEANKHNNPSSVQVTLIRNNTQRTFLNLGRWIRTKSAVLTNTPYIVLLSTVKQLQEGYYRIHSFVSRTHRYLQAARKYERRVQKMRNTISYTTRWIGQSPRNRLEGFGQSGSIDTSLEVLPSPTRESEEIAKCAGLRFEEVPGFALKLEGLVRGTERLYPSMRDIPAILAHFWWDFTISCYKTTVSAFGIFYIYRVGFRRTMNMSWALMGLYFIFEIRDAMEHYWRSVVA